MQLTEKHLRQLDVDQQCDVDDVDNVNKKEGTECKHNVDSMLGQHCDIYNIDELNGI